MQSIRTDSHKAWFILVWAACSLLVIAAALSAQPTTAPAATPASADDTEAKYTADITNRAAKIVDALALNDAAVAERTQKTIVGFYRTLRDWHDTHGAARKVLAKDTTDEGKAKLKEVNDSLAKVRADFLAQLATDGLNTDQIEKVKDGLTYNVRPNTYAVYLDQLPSLKDEEKAQIMAYLTEARDLAISEGSANDKHGVFGKYKGRINNYISKQGYDMKAEQAAWRERDARRKAGTTKPASQPSN